MPLGTYAGFFIFFGLMVLAGLAFVALSHAVQIRVKADKYDWTKPYECGLRTEGLRLDRYPIHYYLVGILFVLFDVETVFFVPWALAGQDFKASGAEGFWYLEMVVFLGILVIGYVYLLQRGVFEWGSKRQAETLLQARKQVKRR